MKTMNKLVLIAVMLISVSFGTARAAPITTLYGTGLDATGNLLVGGAKDPHYSVSPGAGPYVIGSPSSIGWTANTASSQWISPAANTWAGAGPFTYTTTFDLTGFNIGTAQISGSWASDNNSTMFLNGTKVATSPTRGWTALTAFSVTSGFQSGINTLMFIVPNGSGSGDGPTGLQVQITSATAVPEPASLALLGLGLAGLAFGRRKNA